MNKKVNFIYNQTGQAMIEMVIITLLLLTFMFMIVEIAIFYNNLTVVTNAVHQAVQAASLGADDTTIRDVIYNKIKEIKISAFMNHSFDGPYITVYNREVEDYPAISPRSGDETNFSPYRENTAAYIFRAEGYSIEIKMNYKIGFAFPFISYFTTFNVPVIEESRIIERNDEDHDGMVDIYEQEYFTGVLNETWTPYSHSDTSVNDFNNIDDDNDGIEDTEDTTTASGEFYMYARYDRDNDGIEDKYDTDLRAIRLPR